MKRLPSTIPGMEKMLHRGLVASVFAIASLCLNAASLWATDHSGNITSDETWYATDNPHVVTGNVTVDPGVTLNILLKLFTCFISNFSISTEKAPSAKLSENSSNIENHW